MADELIKLIILSIIGLIVIVVLLILATVAQLILHYREKKDIFDRFMARDFREYKYLKEDLPIQLKDKEKRLEESRKQPPLTEEERKLQERAKGF